MLVGIGDSVTAGFGAKNSSHSYFARLAKNPEDEWPDMQGLCLSNVLPNLTQRNISVSGSTSLQHFDAIRERLPTFDADHGIVVMTTGGNDIIHNYGRTAPKEGAMYGATLEQAEPWIANFEQRLSTMMEDISSRFPGGCEIYLADIYDPTDGVGDALSVYLPKWPEGIKIHTRYNEVIRRTAQKYPKVHLVEMHKTFLGHGSHCRQFWRSHYDSRDPHFLVYENIEDPNDRGYDAIRRIFLKTMLENCVTTVEG
ncbi:MAG: SGNH/GDSL hydrolase family protein [Pirellulales bacterium]